MSDDYLTDVFAELGIVPVQDAISTRTVENVVSGDDLSNYARCAVLRTMRHDADIGANQLCYVYIRALTAALTMDEEHGFRTIDDVPHVEVWEGEVVMLDENILRHWQWLGFLFANQDNARRFLEVLPEEVEREAMSTVRTRDRQSVEREFRVITENYR